jgi:hypothetical protein
MMPQTVKCADGRAWRRGAAKVCLLGLLLCGCAGGFTYEDAVPKPAADGTYGGPRDTGRYPNTNIVPKAQTSQFTSEEEQQNRQELDTARSAADAEPADTAPVSADEARLRQVGRTHAKDVLKDIESSDAKSSDAPGD